MFHLCEDKLAMAEALAERIASEVLHHETYSIALSGGRTPAMVFNALLTKQVDWKKVTVLFLDERCVPPEHEDSNYGLASTHLLSHVEALGGLLRMKGELSPEQAALDYSEQLTQLHGPIDCILMGVGEDGHVASLFPNDEEQHAVNPLVAYTTKKMGGHARVSLTMAMINAAKLRLGMASGEGKRAPLAAWATHDTSAGYPLTDVTHDHTEWFVTPDAFPN